MLLFCLFCAFVLNPFVSGGLCGSLLEWRGLNHWCLKRTNLPQKYLQKPRGLGWNYIEASILKYLDDILANEDIWWLLTFVTHERWSVTSRRVKICLLTNISLQLWASPCALSPTLMRIVENTNDLWSLFSLNAGSGVSSSISKSWALLCLECMSRSRI